MRKAAATAAPDIRSAVPLLQPEVAPRSPGARRLLEAAVVAFAERGYYGVPVRDLASAVGMKAASVYAHFASKEALLGELMLLGHTAHQHAVRDAILSAGPAPADQLRDAIRANVLFHCTYPLLTVVANSELHALSGENRDRVLRLRHDSGVLVAAVVERGRAEGAFHVDQTWLAMSAIAGMGVRVAWWFRPEGLRAADSPLNNYPNAAATWLPPEVDSPGAVADAYAEYALRIVGCT
jgi:AcrR family transcriptional regulator